MFKYCLYVLIVNSTHIYDFPRFAGFVAPVVCRGSASEAIWWVLPVVSME